MEHMMSSSTAPPASIAAETVSSTIESYQLATNCDIIQPDIKHRMPQTGTVIGVQQHLATITLSTEHGLSLCFSCFFLSRDWPSVQGVTCRLLALTYIPAKAKVLYCEGASALVALACHARVHPVNETRVLQAKQDKFKGALLTDGAGNPVEEQRPLLVDRRNPMQPLDLDASLQDSVMKEPVLEFAAIFSSIKLLPTAVANAVPSQTSGAALAPPAAFQVSIA